MSTRTNKRKARSTSIYEGENTYTLLYGLHVRSQNPQDIPDTTDAVLLETGVHEWLEDPEKVMQHLKKHVQYKELLLHLEKKGIPVLLADVKFRFDDKVLILLDNVMSLFEWMRGIRMVRSGRGAGAKFVGLWALMPFGSNLLHVTSTITGIGQKQTAALKKLSHRLHPEAEILYLTVRNLIIAEKMRFFADTYAGNRHVVSVLGAGHVGIEDMLDSSKWRTFHFTRLKWFIQNVTRRDYVYSMVQMNFDGKKWVKCNTFEIPSLKQVVV